MRAILTSFGSTGDVQPFIALALELARHGGQPVLAMPPRFEAMIRSRGLPFVPLGPDLSGEQGNVLKTLVGTPDVLDSAARMQQLFGPLVAALPETFEALRAVCAGADVLITGRVQPAARMVHDLTQIPLVTVHAEHSGDGGGTPQLREALRASINPFRERLGLPAFANPLVDADSPQLLLIAMSRHVRKPLASFPPHHHVVGYFALDEEQFRPDAALEAFLAAGPPPLAITFGSMIHERPDALTDLFVEAIGRAGARAILQRGWSGLGERALPPFIHPASVLPHAWLFARASAVVHHGGAGTCGAVFRAGVPHVVVPQVWEQFTEGELAHWLGCAPPAIPYRELTADKLARALGEALTSARLRRAASELGEKVRAEQGLARARQLIEDLLRRIGLSRSSPASEGEPAAAALRREHFIRRTSRARRAALGPTEAAPDQEDEYVE